MVGDRVGLCFPSKEIHNELMLEVPEAEAEEAKKLVKKVMEGALSLDVPLVAEAHLGPNWAAVH